jgi:hypothetical protein
VEKTIVRSDQPCTCGKCKRTVPRGSAIVYAGGLSDVEGCHYCDDDCRKLSRVGMNKRARDFKHENDAQRCAVILDLAAVDPFLEEDGRGVVCFFCDGTENDHTASCVWWRASLDAPKLRAKLSARAANTSSDRVRRAVAKVIGDK